MSKSLKYLAGAALAMTLTAPAVTPALADGARHDLSEICSDGGCRWEKVATCDGFIEGLNFDAEGQMWLLGYFKGEVLKVEGESCTVLGEASGAPNGAKIGPDGNLIVADRAGGIMSVDLETGTRSPKHPSYGIVGFRGLNDLVFAPDGGMYFTEPYGSDALSKVGRVYYVGPGEGAKVELFAEGLAYPNGIAVSADGQRVFVSEFAENRVMSLPARGAKNPFEPRFVFARMQGGLGPDGLTVDSDGNLYVAHFEAGEVVIFDKLGHPYGAVALPEGSGIWTTNVALHGGYLYLTEAGQNVVWRLPVKTKAIGSES